MTANGGFATEKGMSRALDGPLPGARTALVLLLTINLFNYIDRYVLAAVEPKIEEEFFPESKLDASDPSLDEAQKAELLEAKKTVKGKMGLLMTAFLFTYMIAAPVFGWLADRMSRWLLMGVGVILWSLASGASGWAPFFLALLLTRCFVGIGEAAYGPAAPTVISDLYPQRVRGRVLSWFYMAIPVGSALGYGFGGAVLWATGEWRLAFYLVVVPGLLLGAWCFLMREPPRGQADATTPHRHAGLRDWLVLIRTPSYVLNTLGGAAMTFAVGGIAYWIPSYIVEYKHASDLGTVNVIFGGIVVVSGLVATLVGGIAGDRLQRRFPGAYFLVSGAAMLVAFPMVLLVLRMPYPWFWVFIFLAVFCLYFNTGPTNTILANVTHPAIRASAFALNIFVIHMLGDAFSPPLIGLIAGHSNMNIGFATVSGVILLGGIFWLWGARYLERDTALAPTRLADLPGPVVAGDKA
jgi:MFS family permease